MMRLILSLILMICLLPLPSIAQRTRLAAALIDDSVLLTSSFNGAKLTMFGAVEIGGKEAPDIVIIVRGPNRRAWITQKRKIAGLWIGQKRIYFDAAPTYFGVASTRPISQIAPEDTQTLYGLNAISQLNTNDKKLSRNELDIFKTAFVNVRRGQALYIDTPTGVKFFQNGLFRADIKLPDLTPPGLYTVKVMVFKNNRPVDSTLQTFEVSKVGFERWLYSFARDNPLFHGILGLCFALLAGLLSARIFKRFIG